MGTKHKSRKTGELNITYQSSNMTSQVTYLAFIFDDTMTGEPMAYKAIKKSNSRLKILFRKKNFLTPSLRQLLWNALIQLHFGFACHAGYPNLNKKMENKIQATQNKCVWVSHNLNKMANILQNEFENLTWLPLSYRIN